jgi:hypothetical protein
MISAIFLAARRLIMDEMVNVAQISVAVMQFSVAAALGWAAAAAIMAAREVR